jgi:hypothetical protein
MMAQRSKSTLSPRRSQRYQGTFHRFGYVPMPSRYLFTSASHDISLPVDVQNRLALCSCPRAFLNCRPEDFEVNARFDTPMSPTVPSASSWYGQRRNWTAVAMGEGGCRVRDGCLHELVSQACCAAQARDVGGSDTFACRTGRQCAGSS